MAGPDIARMAEQLLSREKTDHRLLLRFHRCHLELLCNRAEMRERLGAYFRTFVRPPGEADITVALLEGDVPFEDMELLEHRSASPSRPGKPPKEAYAELEGGRLVRKLKSGMTFLFGSGINIAAGPCLKNLNQVINFVINRYIQWMVDRGCLLLHASGVSFGGKGIAVCGEAGTGKSTLALRLMEEGALFLSNDRLLLRPEERGLWLYGLAKQPRINPGTALNIGSVNALLPREKMERWLGMDGDELWGLEEKMDVDIRGTYGEGRVETDPVPLSAIIVLRWSRGGGEARFTRVSPRERPDILGSCLKSPGVFYLGSRDPWGMADGDLAEMLKGTPLLLAEGGIDFDGAVRECLELAGMGEKAR